MTDIVRKIRSYTGISQQEFARRLGVSFATVNRWENGHTIPTQMAQEQLYSYCKQHQVPLMDFILEKIAAFASGISLSPGRMLLYHGSKSGLHGPPAPISRKHCDFGSGFYMGTDPLQPLTLICEFPQSRFYVVSVDLRPLAVTEIPEDLEWAMLVAYFRGRMDSVKGTPFFEKYRAYTQGTDVVIGSIANDKMFQVLDDFFLGNITDKVLTMCLSALELGKQYVAITQKACTEVRIECEIPLSLLERRCLTDASEANRQNGAVLANEMYRTYRREGRYFDEILESQV